MTKLINKFLRGGLYYYYATPQYFMPSTTLYKPVVTDVQRDIMLNKPKGTTSAKREIKAKLLELIPVVKATETPEETQQLINKSQEISKILKPVNISLDVAEYIPIVGEGVTLGRTANDIASGDYTSLLVAGIPLAGWGKKLLKKGIKKLGFNISRVKKTSESTPKIKNNKNWFKEEIPAVEGKPAVPALPAKVYDPEIKNWKELPEGMKVSSPYKKEVESVRLDDGSYIIKGLLGNSRYTASAINKLNNQPLYVDIIAPDGTLYGKYLKSAYKQAVPGSPAIPGSPATYKTNWGKVIGTGSVLTGLIIGGANVTNSRNNSTQQLNIQSTQSNNYYQKNISESNPELFDYD